MAITIDKKKQEKRIRLSKAKVDLVTDLFNLEKKYDLHIEEMLSLLGEQVVTWVRFLDEAKEDTYEPDPDAPLCPKCEVPMIDNGEGYFCDGEDCNEPEENPHPKCPKCGRQLLEWSGGFSACENAACNGVEC